MIQPRSGPLKRGGDVRYGVTPNMVLDLSYNTDFAQVEGDQEQVNLTQFSQFFPEKREFFLEGSNLFDFGEAASRRGGRQPAAHDFVLQPAHRPGRKATRADSLLGSKLAGKAGKTSIGALNVLTDAAILPDSTRVERSNFSVLRVKRDVLARSNVGAIFVNKQTRIPDSGWDDYNRAAGVDFSFFPVQRPQFSGVLRAHMGRERCGGDRRRDVFPEHLYGQCVFIVRKGDRHRSGVSASGRICQSPHGPAGASSL